MAGARHGALSSFLFCEMTGIVVWASLPVTGGMLFYRQTGATLHAISGAAVWFGVAAAVFAALILLRRRGAKAGT
jgi:membrane protein DedA with SNARE-associated domain